MLGIKFFLTVVGNVSGITLLTSFSLLKNSDPKWLWRITENSKFYLSNCFNDPNDKGRGRWINSNLKIYLTTKEPLISSNNIRENTRLELRAEGISEEMKNNKVLRSLSRENINLQSTIFSDESPRKPLDSDYRLMKERWQDKEIIKLGEVGAGVDSQTFGDSIKCKDAIFDLTGTGNLRTGLRLDQVTFALKKFVGINSTQLQKKYKDYEVYSINITSSDRTIQLNWANGFQPIVIVPSN